MFAEQVRLALVNHLTLELFQPGTRDIVGAFSLAELRQVQVFTYARSVVYVSGRKANFVEGGVLRSYFSEDHETMPNEVRLMFTKADKATREHEREYRFVFAVWHPRQGILPVRKDPFNLPLVAIGPTVVGNRQGTE